MTDLKNKSELLFLYDVKDANPNGDPLDENKPRIDEETGHNIVTDVRLKRTIRDYLFEYKGFDGKNNKDIFVRDNSAESEDRQTSKKRAVDFIDRDDIIEKCIDIRLFGGTIPMQKGAITLTGPVQFKMGRSLHPVVIKHIQGTGAFASAEGKTKTTFREEDILYYSLIAFHGIVNPTTAKDSEATENDIELLTEGMWEGTKNLISRSKFGQMPRLLLKINYNSPRFFIGDLDRKVAITTDMPFEKLRDITELQLDVNLLKESLTKNKEKIASVEYVIDPRLNLVANGETITVEDLSQEITCNKIAIG